MKKKNILLYLAIILLMFWFMIMYDGWQTELAFWCIVILPVSYAVVILSSLFYIKISFEKNEEIFCQNTHIQKYLNIENKSFLPIPRVELKLKLQDSVGNEESSILVVNVKGKDIRKFPIHMIVNHCGMVNLEITEIYLYDYFGIFSLKKKINEKNTIYIFPEKEERLDFIVKRGQDSFLEEQQETDSNQYAGNNKTEIFEISQYHPGDDVRNIHWKLSAKTDDLMIKHYSGSTHEELQIYVDLFVNKKNQYSACDKLCSVLRSVVLFCERENISYHLYGVGIEGIKETDSKKFLHEIVCVEDTIAKTYTQFLAAEGGLKVFLTSNEIAEQDLVNCCHAIRIPSKIEDTYRCELENHTVLLPEIETEVSETKKKVVILDNDKIRLRKKTDDMQKNKGYLFIMSLLAVFAMILASVSITDVLLLHEPLQVPIIMAFLCLMPNILTNILGYQIKNQKKLGKLRNLIVLGGYILIFLLGKGVFIPDGINALAKMIGKEVLFDGNAYGFLKSMEETLWCFLLLIIYAIADVIYNFSIDYVIWVHLLIMIPLMCIPLLLGALPLGCVTVIGLIYYPLLLTLHQCIRYKKSHKKKYLSDDSEDTTEIMIKSGIITLVATALGVLLITGVLYRDGYVRQTWMAELKTNINMVMEEDTLQNKLLAFKKAFLEKDKEDKNKNQVLSSGARGSLEGTEKIEHTEQTVLQVTVDGEIEFPIYLKSFAGTDYEGTSWVPRSQREIQRQEKELLEKIEKQAAKVYKEYDEGWKLKEALPFRILEYQESGRYVITNKDVKNYEIFITSKLQKDSNIYLPYFAAWDYFERYDVVAGDGYVYSSNKSRGGATDVFTVSAFWGQIDSRDVMKEYGEYPYVISEKNEELKELLEAEAIYADFVQENYLEVPKQLSSIKGIFSKAKLNVDGELVSVNPEKMNLEIGYEPYVQYVRKYLKENFKYTLTPGRNKDKDFIVDFMNRKSGYCVHFASAAVMMFRSMGVPARYVEGYCITGQEDMEKLQLYDVGEYKMNIKVPDSDAHAWVEIYQQGLGWIPVEVTVGNPAFRLTYEQPIKQETTTQAVSNEKQTTTANPLQPQMPTNEVTTSLQETQMSNKEAPKETSSDIGIIIGVAILLIGTAVVVCVYSGRKHKDNMSTEQKLVLLKRRLYRAVKCFHINLKDSQTNTQKAIILHEKLQEKAVSFDDIYWLLEIFDRVVYSNRYEISREDLGKLEKIIQQYTQTCYKEGAICEKIAYKYIKCLYLKRK